jgi:hypothetical protein
MQRLIQGLILAITSYGYWASGGWGVGPYEVTHPLVIEEKREAPAHPPPARLFVSAEGRYAIQQGWLAGADYVENKIATHGEAVAMIMQIASLDWETISIYDIIAGSDDEFFDPDRPLTRRDFITYLNLVFYNLPEEGILDADAEIGFEREITLAEMARAAYRLRGLNPPAE